MKQNGFAPIIILVLIVVGVFIYFGRTYISRYLNDINKSYVRNFALTATPGPTDTPLPTPPQGSEWKTYSNRLFGVTLMYPNFYHPVEKFSSLKSGQSIFIITQTFDFDYHKLTTCHTYKEQSCLLPGGNFNQKLDVLPIKLDGKNAISFFVSINNIDGVNNIIHIIQTIEKPFVEIALSVDGQGGEETFGQILSTFKFIN